MSGAWTGHERTRSTVSAVAHVRLVLQGSGDDPHDNDGPVGRYDIGTSKCPRLGGALVRVVGTVRR